MRNPLKERVIRVFLSVLDSLETLTEESLQAEDVRPQIRHLLARWPDSPVGSEENLTRAALIYWVDDLLIHADWPGATNWRRFSLEHELLGTGHGVWQFFEAAETARHLGYVDALEVFAACQQLGFRGVYRQRSIVRKPVRQIATHSEKTVSAASSLFVNRSQPSRLDNSPSTQTATATATMTASPGLTPNRPAAEWPPKRSRDEVLAALPKTIDAWAATVFRGFVLDDDLAQVAKSASWQTRIPGLPKLIVTATAMVALVGTLCCLVWRH